MKNFWKVLALLVIAFPVFAAETDENEMKAAPALNWDAAPVDLVLQTYGEQIGKTILKDPQVPNANITLKSREGQILTQEEYLEAIEVVLEMNGIHLEPYGERFVRALPRREIRKEGIPLFMDPDDADLERNPGVFVSVMIKFKHISYEEAQKALEGFKSKDGILLCFERTNSILVTDTKYNISRMLEISKSIDVTTPVVEKLHVKQIKYANVLDVQKSLQAIVDDNQKELDKAGKGVQNAANNSTSSSTLVSNRLKKKDDTPTVQENETRIASMEEGAASNIRGRVLILADERSNKLIILTSDANMAFFDEVIKSIDVETTPDVKVEVKRLKYANAEDVADMINDLIGNTSRSSSSTKGNQNQLAKTTPTNTKTSKSPNNASPGAGSGESKAGELSKDNITVLADKRINGLVVMARTVDMPVLHEIIDSLDVKLSQVLIETCIIEVTLGDDLKTGIDWVQNHWTGRDTTGIAGGGGGSNTGTLSQLTSSTGGDKTYSEWAKEAASVMKGTSTSSQSSLSSSEIQNYITAATKFSAEHATVSPAGAGVNYFIKSGKLNLTAVISASKTDSHAKYIASPVVMTVDNKEAIIEATESRKFYSGSTTASGSYNSNVSYNYSDKDLGIKIKVKPKINPNGTVMLEVEEEYSQIGAGQSMLVSTSAGSPSRETVDTALTRKMSADVILDNNQTVVLGGLTEKLTQDKTTGIPILKDIPYIGKWLFSSVSQAESRKELLVFMTPYVLSDAVEAADKAKQLKSALSEVRPWDDNGWSQSELADPVSAKELLRRQGEEWKKQDEEHDSARKLDKAKLERAKTLEERAKKEEEEDAEIEEANDSLLTELAKETDAQTDSASSDQ